MNVYMTEQEQIDVLKRWWKEYGRLTLITLVVVLAVILGYRYWQQRTFNTAAMASGAYEQMFSDISTGNTQQVQAEAQALITEFPGSPYADMATLILAKEQVASGDLKGAQQHLQAVVQHSHSGSLRQIAKLRIARILIAQNQPQAALNELSKMENARYLGLIALVKGDAYVALGQMENARQQYRIAVQALPANTSITSIAKMKYDDLAKVQ